MSLKLDTKQDKDSSPLAPLGKDVEKSLKKRRRDEGDGANSAEADGGLAALATGQAKTQAPAQSKEAAAAAAQAMSHFSDAPQAKSTNAPPKLARPYAVPKPSPSQLRFKKRSDEGDSLDDAQGAKEKPGEAAGSGGDKEQTFS